MNYQELLIRNQYITHGESSILESLIHKAMPNTEIYRQSLNYITSEQIGTLFSGIVTMARNHASIRILYCPVFTSDDIVIEENESFSDGLTRYIRSKADALFSGMQELELKMLMEIIGKYAQVQLCITKDNGIVYNPVGIMTDSDHLSFTFRGGFSAKSPDQYEIIPVFRSWVQDNLPFVNNEIKAFDLIWNHNHEHLTAFDISNILLSSINNTLSSIACSGSKNVIKLRDYQEEAIQCWIDNDCHGFYVMATGTGKTWTAIYSAKYLIDKERVLTVITAPYKHLIKQWGEDLVKVFPHATIIFISSENPSWEALLRKEIITLRYNQQSQLIVISTIASFNMKRFRDAIDTHQGKKLLIVDEAHRFTHRPEDLKKQYQYMLGLSATPYRGKSSESGKELMAFFGGQVYNLPIEKALKMKCLVPYDYHPIFVSCSEEEENKFAKLTQKITTCFNAQGVCINPDLLVTLLRSRLRVIAMAESKLAKLDSFLQEHDHLGHFVVYCGDGKMYEDNSEKRHIQIVQELLREHGYSCAQFTAQETMNERMKLISAFDAGIFSALAAIRCLDEGINIPSIESAMILASNDDYREFVQRRGRILRKHSNKDHADIYDLVVLPSPNTPGIAAIELRRYAEYAKLASNWPQLEPELNRLMRTYGITSEMINVFEFEEEECDMNE